jgi:transcriptional regulator with XRE-family HTH domain
VETGKYLPSVGFVAKAAKALGVSLDSLVSESGEGLEDVHIEDKDLAERLKLLETLGKHERDALITVMDGLLTKHRLRRFLDDTPESGKAG